MVSSAYFWNASIICLNFPITIHRQVNVVDEKIRWWETCDSASLQLGTWQCFLIGYTGNKNDNFISHLMSSKRTVACPLPFPSMMTAHHCSGSDPLHFSRDQWFFPQTTFSRWTLHKGGNAMRFSRSAQNPPHLQLFGWPRNKIFSGPRSILKEALALQETENISLSLPNFQVVNKSRHQFMLVFLYFWQQKANSWVAKLVRSKGWT